ncbi:MAG TPA: glycerophosphodiester phosphodiesterase family protein [Jatrophihabitans sp.]|nr:glycerophosphodiester phosphodiesterase family protein [Jatrophihabitans sp.]
MVRPLSRSRRPPRPPCAHPLVIAHRGASSEVAEHTLPAYLQAIEDGADGLECDVRLTRDGHLVCVHDRTVNRTSNGQGIVSELDLSGLESLDFQSWHDDLPASADELLEQPYLAGVAPDRLAPGSPTVLTLENLLSVVADTDRPVKLLIETKHPTRYGGLVEQELVRMLRRFGWAGDAEAEHRVTIMSFASVALRRVRLLAPAVPLVLLLDRASLLRRAGTLPAGVHTAGPGIGALRSEPSYAERVHAAGNRVYCWTVDEPADVELVHELGVDAIITNRPRQVRGQLGYA